MVLHTNDMPHIVMAVMGKRPSEVRGTVVRGDAPTDRWVTRFRIDDCYADCGDREARIDGECEYLFIRFTDVGTEEKPLEVRDSYGRGEERPQTWDVWVCTYGTEPETWNINIPERVTLGQLAKGYNEAVYPLVQGKPKPN